MHRWEMPKGLDRVEQALEDGVIDDDDHMCPVRVTDLRCCSQRKTDRSTLWFTVEASGVINDDDITRSAVSQRHQEDLRSGRHRSSTDMGFKRTR